MPTITASDVIQTGDDLEISASFTNAAGAAADPATVTFTLIAPDGTGTDYTPAAPEVTNTTVGTYVGVFVPDQPGRWVWRVHGTGGGVESAEVGAVEVQPAPDTAAAPYVRWGMTATVASTLTGTPLSTVQLAAAEEEIVDAIGWRPDPDNYGSADPTAVDHDVRVRAYGRAVAWQAAYRSDVQASATDGADPGIDSESIDNYSVTYRAGSVPDDRRGIPARVYTLLARGGWFAPVRSGRTHTSPG